MAKQEMPRPKRTHIKPSNDRTPVPEIQGKTNCGNAKPNEDKSDLYSGYDTDLAVDNLENDVPEADKRSF